MANKYELMGDINNDGKITHFDSLLLLNHVAGFIDLNENQLSRADLNYDGEITALDPRRILRHLQGVELITDFAVGSE